MLKAMKVRIYPNKQQQEFFMRSFGSCRYIYNRSLALKRFVYKRYGKTLGKYDLMKRLVFLKKRHIWLNNTYSQCFLQSIVNMDLAYKNFFRRIKKGETPGFPRFKSRHDSRQVIQYPQHVRIENNKIYVPKAGMMNARGIRKNMQGKIKTTSITMEAGKYYASILIDDGINQIQESHNGQIIALDMGVENIITDSEGNHMKPICLKKELKQLKRLQKSLSRKEKKSSNRNKSKLKLARQHKRIANIRKDYCHKLSKHYSENQVVIIENLKIANMTTSAKGTSEKPGKNVKAKSGLNRVILQQGWGMLISMLEYKTAARGGKVIKVNPKYTSQKCNKCGHTEKANRQSQSEFECQLCGHKDNADINAAINIGTAGMAEIAWSNLKIA